MWIPALTCSYVHCWGRSYNSSAIVIQHMLCFDDTERLVKKKVQLSCTNAVGLCWNCHSPCNLMDMYLFTPLYLCFTVEIYFCLYPLHTRVHSTWHFVQIHELSFASSAFLCCCCFLASAKIPITVARFSLSDTRAHTHTHRIKAVFRHQMELIHKSNAGLVY